MGLTRGITPDYRIVANSKDITDTIRKHFRSLRLRDEAGTTSDTVEITLDDVDEAQITLPPTGAEIEVSIGYDGRTVKKGMFIVDEIELEGFPMAMTLRGRASPQTKSKGGKSDLQSQKTRSWKKGTTIGAMVAKIAKEHGLTPAVSGELSGISLPHTDQSNESDMNLLHRLAKRYDAIAKPAGGRLVFAKRGAAESVSGEEMARIELSREDVSSVRVTLARRDAPGTVVAYYHDRRKAKRKEVKVGSGEPVRRLRMAYPDKDSAVAAAKAEQRKRARAEESLDLAMAGVPELCAETVVILSGFREGIDGEWLAKSAEHYIGPQGYRCSVEGERPNSDADVKGSGADSADEGDESHTEVGG